MKGPRSEKHTGIFSTELFSVKIFKTMFISVVSLNGNMEKQEGGEFGTAFSLKLSISNS